MVLIGHSMHIVHCRHSTKLASLPLPLYMQVCPESTELLGARHFDISAVESISCHFDYVCHVYMLFLYCTCTIILGGVDTPITCCWVMVVSSLYICRSFCFCCYILGYDVPTCGSRVPTIYVVHVSYCFLLSMTLVVVSCLEFGW